MSNAGIDALASLPVASSAFRISIIEASLGGVSQISAATGSLFRLYSALHLRIEKLAARYAA